MAPYLESTFVAGAPAILAGVALYPLLVLIIFRFYAWWPATILVLVAAAWRDIILLELGPSSLIAALTFALVYGGLTLLLTNRSLVVDIVSGVVAYAVYLLSFWGAGNLIEQLNPSNVVYHSGVATSLVGIVIAGCLAGLLRHSEHRTQQSIPFPHL